MALGGCCAVSTATAPGSGQVSILGRWGWQAGTGAEVVYDVQAVQRGVYGESQVPGPSQTAV